MYLDAVNQTPDIEFPDFIVSSAEGRSEVFTTWQDWVPSQISHHGEICCEIAREWVAAADFSFLHGSDLFTGPRWLRNTFKWVPSGYPIYWCEAVRRKVLDCGALAALAHEGFAVRGVRGFRARLVQRFSTAAPAPWSCNWSAAGTSIGWIKDDLIYHEGCAIEIGDEEIKVWDASAGWW